MTIYQAMTIKIDSYTETAIDFEKDGGESAVLRGMIMGATNQRDELTVEAAECTY